MSSEAIYTIEEIDRLCANQKNNKWSLRTLVSVAIDHTTNKGLTTTIMPSSIQNMLTELYRPYRFNSIRHFFNFLYDRERNYAAAVASSREEDKNDF